MSEKCDLEQIVFVALIGREIVGDPGTEIRDIVHAAGRSRDHLISVQT